MQVYAWLKPSTKTGGKTKQAVFFLVVLSYLKRLNIKTYHFFSEKSKLDIFLHYL